ncbi:MAG: hypothetical protein A2V93_01300 [Ignavibacteria bacterium RBG_16_34_14]|nr:MAG: hypothetical protein A2V93_01300 [Ignavibacteria bacterium RBG_16_34_14]
MGLEMKKIFLLLLLVSPIHFTQELDCKVIVNYESLPVLNREILAGFAQVVQDYMNMTRFTEEDWNGPKISCTMNIFFLSASSEVNYTAQAVIISQRPIYNTINFSSMLTVNDNTWSFIYERGQSLYSNRSTFDPLTSFLDYYANIIIGYDWDSYEKLGGSPYFSKAFNIVNLGSSSGFPGGWQTTSLSTYSRWNLVQDLLNEKYRPFREAFYNYHYNGLDIFLENKSVALEQMTNFVKTLEEMKAKVDLNTVLIKTFFDSKYGELTDFLRHANNPELFKTLKKIDPSHAAKYDEVLNKMQ